MPILHEHLQARLDRAMAETEAIAEGNNYYLAQEVEPVVSVIKPKEAWIVETRHDSCFQSLVTCGKSALPMIDIDNTAIDTDDGALIWAQTQFEMLQLSFQGRLYRTRNGFRLLVESQTMSPEGALFALLAKSFACDAKYLELCKAQKCFRARITSKEISIDPEREEAVCRYIATIGSGGTCPQLAELIALHDEWTNANDQFAELV